MQMGKNEISPSQVFQLWYETGARFLIKTGQSNNWKSHPLKLQVGVREGLKKAGGQLVKSSLFSFDF